MKYSDFQKRTKKFYSAICNCMYVDNNLNRCKNRPISSHSLQKSKALRSISENGHVYSLGYIFSPTNAELDFRLVGHSKASTFPGYCKKHDGELFRDIEDGFKGFNERVYCLLTLRTLAREYFAKLAQIRLVLGGEGKSRFVEAYGEKAYNNYLLGCKLSQKELETIKSRLEKMLAENEYSSLITRVFLFDSPIPLAFSGTFSPEHSLSGTHILPEFHNEWGAVFAFCGKVGRYNILLLSSLDGQSEAQIDSFFASLDTTEFNPRVLALNIGLEYLENSFYKPSWIDKLSFIQKKKMTLKFQTGMPGQRMNRSDLYTEINIDI